MRAGKTQSCCYGEPGKRAHKERRNSRVPRKTGDREFVIAMVCEATQGTGLRLSLSTTQLPTGASQNLEWLLGFAAVGTIGLCYGHQLQAEPQTREREEDSMSLLPLDPKSHFSESHILCWPMMQGSEL